MAYPGKWLKVNGTTIPGLKEYKLTYAKLWKNAERNMNGDVSANLIGIFPKIELLFRDGLTEDEIAGISNLLNIAYFTAEFYNPKVKGASSAQYYASDFSVEVLERQRGLFKGFNVNLVPVSRDMSTGALPPDRPTVTYDDGEKESF